MSFASVLDAYCNAIGCTNKEIAERCSLSPSALSRYRNGERTPEIGSDIVDRLVTGISMLSNERGIDKSWREDIVRSSLEATLSGSKMLGLGFGSRLSSVMTLLGMKNSEVAQVLGVSPSYISRIRSGQRMPSGQRRFAERFANAASQRCLELGRLSELLGLVGIGSETESWRPPDFGSPDMLAEVIEQWLLGNNVVESDLAAVEGFFEQLNAFYFEEQIALIHAQKPYEPSFECAGECANMFYGSDHIREAEKAFFDLAIARGAQEVYLSSDVPLLEMTLASDFVGSYRERIGCLVRNGAHITVVHSAERPIAESVMSLRLWLPLYLTGLVKPVYLRGVTNRLFCHTNYTSDVCFLICDSVMGHQADGRCFLSTKPDDVAYGQQKMRFIMERVVNMLEIYHDDAPEERARFEQVEAQLAEGGRSHIINGGRYPNLRILSYSSTCATISILTDPAVHLVLRHPRLCYAISHLK